MGVDSLDDLRRQKARKEAAAPATKRKPSAAARTLALTDTREQRNRAKPIVELPDIRLVRVECGQLAVHYARREALVWEELPEKATKEERKRGPRKATGLSLCAEEVVLDKDDSLKGRKVCEACRVEASRMRAMER
jgi:hypothetical protein